MAKHRTAQILLMRPRKGNKMAAQSIGRSFSRLEKTLFLVLAVIIIAAAYYFGVIKNVADTKTANTLALEEIDSNIAAQRELEKIRLEMEDKLANMGSLTELPEVASYDNFSNELNELNKILATASSYNLNFSNPTQQGDTIRRVVNISFTTASYNAAFDVIKSLQKGSYYSLITDFNLSAKVLADGSIESVAGTAKVTFFETTAGSDNLDGVEIEEA